MDLTERNKIYSLLRQFYPRARQLQSKETLTAWGFILKDFTYEDVKKAVLTYAAKNKFFPDLADLTANLTPAKEEPRASAQNWFYSDVAKECFEKLDERTREIGACAITSKHRSEGGMMGLLLRSYCPEECEGCEKLEKSGCLFIEKIKAEQANCRLLKEHGGMGQREALLTHWVSYCRTCQTPCFWRVGMRMLEEEQQ